MFRTVHDFGNQTFGTSGLSTAQNSTGSPALGKERAENTPLNVVVSGWKIYNNKGAVVEQYEPFFDKGFEYVLPRLSTISGTIAPQLGVKIKMFYDPLGINQHKLKRLLTKLLILGDPLPLQLKLLQKICKNLLSINLKIFRI